MNNVLIKFQYRFLKYQMLLMTLVVVLQRSPMMRILTILERAIKAPMSRMVQFTTGAVATVGVQQAVTGATTFTANPASPTTATVGQSFNLAFAVTGAPSAVGSWEVLGNLPPGLSIPGLSGTTLNVKVGSIAGVPTTPGTYDITVQPFEKLNLNGDTNKQRYPISITVDGETPPPVTIFSASPSSNVIGQAGASFLQTFSISGMTAASWEITGALPPGLNLRGPNGELPQGNTLNAVSGEITGTPTQPGVFNLSLRTYDQPNLAGITDGMQHSLAIAIEDVVGADLPTVTYQPKNAVVYPLDRVQFFVKGEGYTSIQWLKDGVEIAAAQEDSLVIESTTNSDAGNYQARLTNASGSTLSAIATLVLDANAKGNLVNVSTRGFIGNGEEVLIPGFVFAGQKAKTFLIRAGGPSLSKFGLTTAHPDPIISVYDGPNLITQNDDWNLQSEPAAIRQAIIDVGAAPFDENSKDSAILVTLPPGGYTAIASGKNGVTGVALVEVYEVAQ